MRFGRKAGIHSDWIISMAIFLISIVFLLTFLKPGQQDLIEPTNIFNIIEQGLEKGASDGGVYHKINRTVIFPDPDVVGADHISITNNIYNGNDIAYTFEGAVEAYQLQGSTPNFQACKHDSIILLNAPSISNGLTAEACTPLNPAPEILGTTEILNGINLDLIQSNLCTTDDEYKAMKQTLGLTEYMELKIEIFESAEYPPPTGTATHALCDFKEPYEQADVFVKDKRTWILNKDGTKTGVRIHMEVWY